jgi:predicted metal-dependent HD superfamily phosphohydrolase
VLGCGLVRQDGAVPPTPSRPLGWLRRQWATVVGAVAPAADPAAVDAAGERVLERYREPHRRYHTTEHLAEVLQTVRSLSDPADPGVSFRLDTPAQYHAASLAAWYHDAIYDPRATTNEEESATLAVDDLRGLDVAPDLVTEVARLVRLTATHQVASDDDPGMVMIDADLAILGARPARYDRYARDVRAEYAHVPDDAWRRGRADVLRRFLDLGSIYHCELMVVRCDANARRNLGRELESLGEDPTTPQRPAGGT